MNDEIGSQWGSEPERRRWAAVLEKTGAENVRARLAQADFGSVGAIAIGIEHSMTKGYAEEWLAAHDARKAAAEEAHRVAIMRWTKTAGIGAMIAAGAAVAAAFAGAFQAVFSYMALK